MNLANTNSNEVAITLKEITDLISVEHNKAMKKVEALTKEPSFGEVAKTSTLNLNNVKVETYLLSKRQAIAVGAKLNNALLMKVIDRLEELEGSNFKILTVPEQIALIVKGHGEIEQRLDKIENNSRLDNLQEFQLIKAKNQRTCQLIEEHKLVSRVAHMKVWKIFKEKFQLPKYNALPNGKFQDGLDFLRNVTIADLV